MPLSTVTSQNSEWLWIGRSRRSPPLGVKISSVDKVLMTDRRLVCPFIIHQGLEAIGFKGLHPSIWVVDGSEGQHGVSADIGTPAGKPGRGYHFSKQEETYRNMSQFLL